MLTFSNTQTLLSTMQTGNNKNTPFRILTALELILTAGGGVLRRCIDMCSRGFPWRPLVKL